MAKSSNERDVNFRLILDSTVEAIYALDLNGICNFCNSTCLRMLGYEQQDELLGQAIHTLIQPTRADGSPYRVADSQIQKALVAGEIAHVDTEVLFRKDGSCFAAEYWCHPLNSEGELTGCVVTFLDISKRKQAEKELEESHALHRQAEQMGQLGHWVWDHINSRMLSCSDQFAQIFEMSVDEAIDYFSNEENELGIVHPDDREYYEQKLRESEDQLIPVVIDYRVTLASGKQRYVQQRSDLVLDDDGKIIRSYGTVQDLTEGKQAQEDLQKSHALFAQAEQIGKLGYWEWDFLSDRLTSCSEQYAKIFDMTVEQMLGVVQSLDAEIDELVYHEDRQRYAKVVNKANSLRQGWDIEYRGVTRKGKIVHVHEIGEPVVDENGKLIRTFGTIQDISELHRAVMSLEHEVSVRRNGERIQRTLFLIAQLAAEPMEVKAFYAAVHSAISDIIYARNFYVALIDEEQGMLRFPYWVNQEDANWPDLPLSGSCIVPWRSSNLPRVRVVQAEKLAPLGGLVAGVAHEINTPLGVAITATTHLQRKMSRQQEDGAGSNINQPALDLILGNLQRASKLVSSFKLVAADQASGERRKFNLHDQLEATLISMQPIIRKGGHRMELRCDARIEVDGYPSALYQIVANLVTNSIAHGFKEDRGGEIILSISQRDELLLLSYKDNGKGISDEVCKHIFEPFFTTSRSTGSTGLGLHIVYNLVSQMGGKDRSG